MQAKYITMLLMTLLSLNSYADGTLYQVATIGSLAQGVYDGTYTYGELKKHGDFGLGTFADLNGEMVALDGQYYQIEASGKLKVVADQQIVPFAEVTNFKPTKSGTFQHVTSFQDLDEQIEKLVPNKNIPYAFQITGTFKTLKLRSFYKQKKPYPLLTQAAKGQAIFNMQNVKGTIIGFWFPAYWAGIAVGGLHLHFVTEDRTTGGHVLGITFANNSFSMQDMHTVTTYLPDTPSFAQANLIAKNLQTAIKQAEGSRK